MQYHYTYRITNTYLSLHYYGTRTSSLYPSKDLGIYYFSSSTNKLFIQDQKDNPNNYKYKVVRITKSRKAAIELEIKLHNKFNVGINESFYNKAKQTSTGFDTQGTKQDSTKRLNKLNVKDIYGNNVFINTSEYDRNIHFRHDKNMVHCIVNNKKCLISKEEFYKNDYKTYTSDMVTAKHLISGEINSVSLDIFNSDKFYITPTTKYCYSYNNVPLRNSDLKIIGISRCKKALKRITLNEYLELLNATSTT